MYLSIAWIAEADEDARDLGYLLAKHPDKVQRFDLPYGPAWVYYPEATASRTRAVLQMEVDAIGLVRNRRFRDEGFALSAYVNDRPYSASSMMAVAIKRVFGSALAGTCKARPDLLGRELSLEIELAGVSSRLVHRFFEPLGWVVEAGEDSHVRLAGRSELAGALQQLYVLLPALDGSKHYWVGDEEVDKLVAHGGDWLPSHPERDLITKRYLGYRSLAQAATRRWDSLDEGQLETNPDEDEDQSKPHPLRELRREAITQVLTAAKVQRVVDVGCGEGGLIKHLLAETNMDVLGLDVSSRELAKAAAKLRLDQLPDRRRARVELGQTGLTYVDQRLAGADAVVLSEVIEHLEPDALASLESTIFAQKPRNVVVTTPNVEFNPVYNLTGWRHPDHRFEWTRAEFEGWARELSERCGYTVSFRGVGPEHPERGSPTQLAWFEVVQ